MNKEKTLLSLGNLALRNGKYSDAIRHYKAALLESPALEKSIKLNIEIAQKKLGEPIIQPLPNNSDPSSQIEIIKSEHPDHHPDFFSIKARLTKANLLVVTRIENTTELLQLNKQLSVIENQFELLLLVNRELTEKCKPLDPPASCKYITIIGFPNKTGKAGAFIRTLTAGVFGKYPNLVWLDNIKAEPPVDTKIIQQFCDEKILDIGLLSEKLITLKTLETDFSKKHLGVWFARLHKTKPDNNTLAPKGSFIIRSLILKQFAGMNINPGKLDALDKRADTEAFQSLCSVIGAFVSEGMLISAELSNAQQAVEQAKADLSSPRKVKTIAFFLPQFHIIPENDAWWGKGFTEWNNVVRAKPLFRSHYQPRLPADLGFYDLRSQTTQIAQAELASKYGIHGFCYYYYWFNGTKLLNEPIEQMLKSGKPDFPFCVCWANENWSRNWDGQNRYVLMEQNYSRESNLALIKEFISMMKDPRYIRHNGKPVLLVYRIKIIPNWLETAAMWREECRKAGIGEIHLCSIRFGLEPLEGMPSQHGLDAYVLFPPQDMKFVDARKSVYDLNPNFNGTIYSYDEVVEGDISRFRPGYQWPVHRGAMLGWDNTARRLTASRIFTGCTPMRYRAWLKQILEQEEQHNINDESLLFINAWNEWAEGTTLEPDQRYGTSYLEATHSALARYNTDSRQNSHIKIESTAKQKPRTNKFIKPLHTPKTPEWLEGKANYKPGAATVLLCAHISGHQLFGGERSFLDILNALDRLDLNIIVTLPSSNNKQYIENILSKSIGIYAFPYPQWMAAREPDPMLLLIFADIIAAHNVSIVYSNTIVLIEPALAAKKMGRVSIVHARELITLDDALRERIGLPVQTILKTVFNRYDFIIANSKATERIFAREDRTFYVPNAVDAKAIYTENKCGTRLRFGIISSNIPKKGVADFIEVAKHCHDLTDQAEFIVIGPDNPQIEAWRKEVTEGQLPNNLKFLGYRESPREAMAELNVLLNLSSFAESFGRTVAEAMAAKRPVIAYEWGALPELVQHERTGYLVPFGDVPRVAEYVRRLCKDRSLISKLGDAGHAIAVQSFSHKALFTNLQKAINTIRHSFYWDKLSKSEIKSTACNPVTIIIPVYNAPDEVKNCIDSVLQHTSLSQAEILIINDGSTDTRIINILKQYEGKPKIRVIYNEKNIGYTRTINRGIYESGEQDVILLNSDTVVTPAWLSAMRASAYAYPRTGTVTAMSDNAGAFSFPKQGVANLKPDYLTHDEYAMRIIDQTLGCDFVDVPTGSGFCMYIRRDLIKEIGLFDEVLFPRGYGEENDFCMRANEKNWRNVITSWAFIYHARTASFKGEKEKLVQAGVDAVTRKYPDYALKTKAAFNSESIIKLRKSSEI